MSSSTLIDSHGRRIDYVRLSVTDRCNFRCTYCMAEDMAFLPRRDLLTLEEIAELARHLVMRGVKRIRLTGGEPLVRRGIGELAEALGALRAEGLDELTMTTNGTALPKYAMQLAAAGMRRINVSLDTLDAGKFAAITRGGVLAQVLAGIDAAQDAGLAVKINMVALKGFNDGEFAEMLAWCGARGLDLSLIETMPLGEVSGSREDSYLPLAAARDALEASYTLIPSTHRTGGPSRYCDVVETGTRVGFITPCQRQFLRRLQPYPGFGDRHRLWLPGPRPEGRAARYSCARAKPARSTKRLTSCWRANRRGTNSTSPGPNPPSPGI